MADGPAADPPGGGAKAKGGKPGEAAPADGVVGGPLMTVVVRNEFYHDGFRNLIRIAIGGAIIIVALILTFIAYINMAKSRDHYFATTSDGRIMQLTPPQYANMGDSALLSWATQTASEVMTFGYHDYERRMDDCAQYLTPHGWETFRNALRMSRVIDSVQALQQVVSAEPSSAPSITWQGAFNGEYRWVVQLPLRVTYQSGTESRIDNPIVTLVIKRVPSLESQSGVGIDQWIETQPGAAGRN
jgi:intracellular multiplication protein IcmL